MPIKVLVEAEVNPTEELNKVKRAIKNVFVPAMYRIENREGKKYLVAEGYGSTSLIKLYKLLRMQRILDAAREYILKGVQGNKIVFYLHKQAAFAGVATFCDEEIESPLGPIKFTIECSDIEAVVNWLTPKTYQGKPIREHPPPD
ncbi:MAG: hypothetical protein DRN15_10125 [Thermoprotei archaeon]|nr:MAG: hypothetical protein DRN15_10125 [Thermoprotei archaeon]RLF24841.1 MAG: hypothetical protein DRM97_02810 [Thermoprotei archaeon]